MTSSLPSFRRKLESTSSPRCPFARELPWMPPPPPVIPAKAGIHVASPESAWPGVGVDDGIPPVFPAKAGIHVPSPESACPRVAIDTAPPRHSGESRKPRTPTLRDSPLTPDDGQPLRQPKRGTDVDPGFRRGDGVGSSGHLSSQTEGGSNPPTRHLAHPPSAIPPPPSRHSGGSRNPRTPTLRDSPSTPQCGQPLRQPKRGRNVDPGFRRGDGVGPSGRPSSQTEVGSNPPTRHLAHPSRLSGESRNPRRPPGLRSPASCQRHRHPTRHSGESRNPRTPTLRDSPLNSTLRSTTETAEAWKGRGPRLSPGRRSRAAPHPSFRRKPESTHPNPQGQRVDSTLRPTTEAAEAWKRRGPRLSPGRRSRAIGETE